MFYNPDEEFNNEDLQALVEVPTYAAEDCKKRLYQLFRQLCDEHGLEICMSIRVVTDVVKGSKQHDILSWIDAPFGILSRCTTYISYRMMAETRSYQMVQRAFRHEMAHLLQAKEILARNVYFSGPLSHDEHFQALNRLTKGRA